MQDLRGYIYNMLFQIQTILQNMLMVEQCYIGILHNIVEPLCYRRIMIIYQCNNIIF